MDNDAEDPNTVCGECVGDSPLRPIEDAPETGKILVVYYGLHGWQIYTVDFDRYNQPWQRKGWLNGAAGWMPMPPLPMVPPEKPASANP